MHVLISASYPGSNGACTDAGVYGFPGNLGTWLCAIATSELNTPTLRVVMILPVMSAVLPCYFFCWTRAVEGGTWFFSRMYTTRFP